MRAAIAGAPSCRRSPRRAARAPASRRAAALFAELQRSLVAPRASPRPPCAQWPTRRRTLHELAALYSAYRPRLEALGAVDPDRFACARARRAARTAGSLGPTPRAPLRLRRPDARAARRGGDARAPRRRRGHRRAHATSRAAPRSPGARRRSRSCASRCRRGGTLLERAPSTTRRRPRRAAPPRARAVRAVAARVAPNGAVRLLEAGGERAEAELVAAEVLELLRDGMARRGHRRRLSRGRARRRRWSPRSSAPTGSRSPRPSAAPLRAHRARHAACSRSPARALPTATAHDLLAWLRTPGKLRARRSWPTGWRLSVRGARRSRTVARRARCLGGGVGAAGRCASSTRCAAPPPTGPRRCSPRSDARPHAVAAPHARRRDVLDAGRGGRRARRSRAAARRSTSSPSSPRPTRASRRRRRRSCWRRSAASRSATRRAAARGRGAARRPAGDPRAPLPRGVRVRPAGGRVPARGRRPSRSSDDEPRARSRSPTGLVLPPTRTRSPRERSLFYACVSRPRRLLFLSLPQLRRGGRAAAAVAVPRRRARAVHRRAVDAARPAAAGRGHLAARRGADAARAAPRRRPRARRPRAAGAARARRPGCARRCCAARDRESAARAGDVRRLPGASGWSRRAARPSAVEPDPEPMVRGSLVHARARARRCAAEGARPAPRACARHARRRAGRAARGERAALSVTRRGAARAGAAARAGGRPRALHLRHEAHDGGALRARPSWSGASAGEDTLPRSRSATTACARARRDRPRRPRRAGRAIVRDYKGRTVYAVAGALWQEDGQIQAALYMLAVRELLGLEPVGALYQPIGGDRPAPPRRRPRRRRRRRRRTSTATSRPARSSTRRLDAAARERRDAGRRRPARRPHHAVPATAAPTAAAAPTRRSAGRSTHERAVHRRAARGDRAPAAALLLAANAGSGKTAVMVERFADAVREDGVAVGAILALTFTEKAAGELTAARLRRRFDRARRGRARPRRRRRLDRHDPRLLRAAAALPAARRRAGPALRGARRARRRAARRRGLRRARWTSWATTHGAAAIDLAAAYGPAELRARSSAPHASLRAARAGRAAAPDRRARRRRPGPQRAGARARRRPRRELAPAEAAGRSPRAASASPRCAALRERALDGRAAPRRAVAALDAAELKGGAKALAVRRVRGLPRRAGGAYRAACADHHAPCRALRCSTGCCDRFGDATTAAKAERAAVDFEDLELRARDLLAEPEPLRAALGRALRADHGRRVPGHERGSSSRSWRRSSATTCSRSATSSSRSTASATPT